MLQVRGPGAKGQRSGWRLALVSAPSQVVIDVAVGLHPNARLRLPSGHASVTAVVECTPDLDGPVKVLSHSAYVHGLARGVALQILRSTGSTVNVTELSLPNATFATPSTATQ